MANVGMIMNMGGDEINAEILHSLGLGRNRTRKLRSFIISPFSVYYRSWEILLALLVAYNVWAWPFEVAFLDKRISFLFIIDSVVNGLFAIDIVITFFVAYLDKSTYLLVDDPKKIARKYATSWLLVDFISVIPSEVAMIFSPKRSWIYGLLIMFRLFRLRRLGALFARLERDINYSYFAIKFVKLICITLFSVHFGGCFYYFLDVHYHDPKKTWIAPSIPDFHHRSLLFRYVTALCWFVSTSTTVRYGDLHAITEVEMTYTVVYLLFNYGFKMYILGTLIGFFLIRLAR